MQMAKTSQLLGQLDEAGILTISLVTDPTFGGVAASFATLCEVVIAEPGARLGFAGRRVIEQTIRQTLPPDFQTAEFLLANGPIDMIRQRQELRRWRGCCRPARGNRPCPTRRRTARQAPRPRAAIPGRSSSGPVTSADPPRWTTSGQVLDDFEELRGDRLGAEDPVIVGGLGRLAGVPVVVVGHQKGHTAAELAARNFGMPTPPATASRRG